MEILNGLHQTMTIHYHGMNKEIFKMTKEEARNIKDVVLEDSRLYFHNFDGKSQYHNSGDIEYGVVIDDPDFAEALAKEGWDIRVKEYDDGNKRYYIKAKINFDPRRKKDNSLIEEFVPSVFVYVEDSESMVQITSKEEMAMYETNPESNTRVDVVKVDCQLAAKYSEMPTPHIVAYTRHLVLTVRIIEKKSNANIRFSKFAGIKGYSD